MGACGPRGPVSPPSVAGEGPRPVCRPASFRAPVTSAPLLVCVSMRAHYSWGADHSPGSSGGMGIPASTGTCRSGKPPAPRARWAGRTPLTFATVATATDVTIGDFYQYAENIKHRSPDEECVASSTTVCEIVFAFAGRPPPQSRTRPVLPATSSNDQWDRKGVGGAPVSLRRAGDGGRGLGWRATPRSNGLGVA